jgi:HEAT repeat protein
MNEPNRLAKCVDQITTEVMTLWFQHHTKRQEEKVAHLTRALPSVAFAGGRCENLPLMEWMRRKASADQNLETRRALSEALLYMAEMARRAEEMIPSLLASLRDSNRLIRARAAGALAQLGPSAAAHPEVIPALLRCAHESQVGEGYVPTRFLDSPVSPDRIYLYLEDFRDNSPAAFALSVVIAALGKLETRTPAALSTLRHALQDRLWLIGMIAAEALNGLGAAVPLTQSLIRELTAGDRRSRQRAARSLGRLAAVAVNETEIIPALTREIHAEDPILAATAAEALGQLGGIAVSYPEVIASLQAAVKNRDNLCAPAFARALAKLQTTADLRANITPALLHILRGYESPRLETSTQRPDEDHSNGSAIGIRPAWILFLDVQKGDPTTLGAEAEAARQRELETAVLHSKSYQAAAGKVSLFPVQEDLALAFYDSVETTLQCAAEITAALRSRSHYALKIGIYYGEIALQKSAAGGWEVVGKGIALARAVASCGDPGHILLSNTAAASLPPRSPWKTKMTDLGECVLPDRSYVHLYNLFHVGERIGNPALPSRVALYVPPRRGLRNLPTLRQALSVLLLLTVIGGATALALKPQLLHQARLWLGVEKPEQPFLPPRDNIKQPQKPPVQIGGPQHIPMPGTQTQGRYSPVVPSSSGSPKSVDWSSCIRFLSDVNVKPSPDMRRAIIRLDAPEGYYPGSFRLYALDRNGFPIRDYAIMPRVEGRACFWILETPETESGAQIRLTYILENNQEATLMDYSRFDMPDP